MSNVTDIETLQAVTAGTDGLEQTAVELQSLSASMRNVSAALGDALKCRYTDILQDSVARICSNIEQHASVIKASSTDVRNIANQCVSVAR